MEKQIQGYVAQDLPGDEGGNGLFKIMGGEALEELLCPGKKEACFS